MFNPIGDLYSLDDKYWRHLYRFLQDDSIRGERHQHQSWDYTDLNRPYSTIYQPLPIIFDHYRPATTITDVADHCWPAPTIKGHIWSLPTISDSYRLSHIIIGYQWPLPSGGNSIKETINIKKELFFFVMNWPVTEYFLSLIHMNCSWNKLVLSDNLQ